MVQVIAKDDQYVLNHATKCVARTILQGRHGFGRYDDPDDLRNHVSEGWRFPVVDSYSDGNDAVGSYGFNEVTFIYRHPDDNVFPQQVSVMGTFANLYDPLPMRSVQFLGEEIGYYTTTIVIPKGEVHRYKYFVDGQLILDPVNPQRVTLSNGKTWSRFFTQLCAVPLVLERSEIALLDRLTDHILPFRTEAGQRFLNDYYNYLDRHTQEAEYRQVYRLDASVGVVNFIDKLLAKEENHHLIDYKICLDMIDKILRQRINTMEPSVMPKTIFIQLYDEMASGDVPGWEYNRYDNPRHFLQLLRRHTYTGAFSHPKYGGNAQAAGWAYLSQRFRDLDDKSLFNWQQAIERPVGTNQDYHG
ncbi:MAG: gluconate 2-dehydrogenase subunit 3 family protein [Ardenticatenaceae bacterium]